ncbi:MAG: hypothetical protein REJ23_00490 [Brevundimonas sp.]|nr:hypothetical protein [Brevundimonas sp.]
MKILAGNVHSTHGLFNYGTTEITEFAIVNQEGVKRAGGTIGWGVAGLAALGPLGLIAGLVAGGKGTDVTFTATFADGRQMLARTDSKSFRDLQAVAFESIRRRALIPTVALRSEHETQRLEQRNASLPANLTDPVDQAEWLLKNASQAVQRQAKQPGQRISLLLAKDSEERRFAIAIVPDALTPYNLRQIADVLKPYEGNATLVAVGRSVGPEARAESNATGLVATTVSEMMEAINRAPRPFDF